MATSYPQGTIKNILIRNIGKFEGCHELDLTSDSRIVTLVGGASTGKSTLLNAIGNTHFLKLPYKVVKDNNDNTFLNIDSPEEHKDQNGSTPQNIKKCTKKQKSFLMIESIDAEKKPVYYGLYSGEDEDSWYWHHKQEDGSYRYSTMFFYSHQDGKLYLLSPQKTMTRGVTDKLIEEFQLQFQDPFGRYDVYREILNCLKKPPKDLLKCIPSDKVNLLPSRVEDFERTSTDAIVQYVIDHQSNCLLFQNIVEDSLHSTQPKFLEDLHNTNKQIIIKNTAENALSYSLIIRHWETTKGTWQVCPIKDKNKFLDQSKKFTAIKILCSRENILTEGKSDYKVLKNLLLKWEIKERINIEKMNGKGGFPSAASFFLKHAYLGLTHLIVCDGDCLTGGASTDVGENRAKTLTKPVYNDCTCKVTKQECKNTGICHCLLQKHGRKGKEEEETKGHHSDIMCNKLGILAICAKQISDTGVGSLYEMLSDDLDTFRDSCKAKHTSKVMFEYLSGKPTPNVEHLWDFSESYLRTFVWKAEPNFDLESVLNLESKKCNKKSLKKSKYKVAPILKKCFKENNRELDRLKRFIEKYYIFVS